MALMSPGKIRVSLHILEMAAKQCADEHGWKNTPIITDLVVMDENHPDNVWAREKGYPEHFLMVEFEDYNTREVAGYGISSDGKASCFYD